MPHSARNRRRSARKPHKLRAMVELGGSCSLASIVSFAREGVGLATDIHTLPRRFDRVRVQFKCDQGEIVLTGDVRWSTARSGTRSEYGVELRDAGAAYTGFYDSLPN